MLECSSPNSLSLISSARCADWTADDKLLCSCCVIIIITLFESQIILAEHECCTNWGDCKSNKSNQIKCWFLRRGENRSSRRKTSRSRVENQQTQPTYDAGSGNRTRDTLVEGERSHHYTNPAPQSSLQLQQGSLVWSWEVFPRFKLSWSRFKIDLAASVIPWK